ncbi:DUF1990 family protein [Kitasatospora sp. LaBMicrA B282]|uniref:DUF1990 family protein n=1 Tax=Kitasatospora sp. LaBMicrA B282 TaxID=3420949 RepID=UPI003D0B63BD
MKPRGHDPAGHPAIEEIVRRHRAACAAAPSYPEVGATRAAALPPGYSWLRRRIHLGRGPAVLDRAGEYVLRWGTQLGTGFAIHPPPARITPGDTVLLRVGLPHLRRPRLVVPCRVIWTVEQPDRIGFAYGTLPGHPECGEESFVVSLDAAGDVWFEVTAFSRPAAWYARLGGPLTAVLQHLATERYLRSVARAAAAD